MNVRMIKAEILKLVKRRGLMAWALFLTAGGVLVMFTVLAVRHGSNPHKYGPAGGRHNFENAMFFLSSVGAAAGVLIGAYAGAGDVDSGVFRDLVATGRSRKALFQVRWIGALIVFLPLVLIGIAIVMLASTVLAASLAAPSLVYMLKAAGWVLVSTLPLVVVAVGAATLFGARPAITALLSWEIIVTPLLLRISFLGHGRDALLGAATRHFAPAGIIPSHGVYAVGGAVGAIVTILAWVLIARRLGSWRTQTLDA